MLQKSYLARKKLFRSEFISFLPGRGGSGDEVHPLHPELHRRDPGPLPPLLAAGLPRGRGDSCHSCRSEQHSCDSCQQQQRSQPVLVSDAVHLRAGDGEHQHPAAGEHDNSAPWDMRMTLRAWSQCIMWHQADIAMFMTHRKSSMACWTDFWWSFAICTKFIVHNKRMRSSKQFKTSYDWKRVCTTCCIL